MTSARNGRTSSTREWQNDLGEDGRMISARNGRTSSTREWQNDLGEEWQDVIDEGMAE